MIAKSQCNKMNTKQQLYKLAEMSFRDLPIYPGSPPHVDYDLRSSSFT